MAWAGLAVGIGVMIAVNERRHPLVPQPGDAGREVARATAPAAVEPERKPGAPPSIQAASDSNVTQRNALEAPALATRESENNHPPASAHPHPFMSPNKSLPSPA